MRLAVTFQTDKEDKKDLILTRLLDQGKTQLFHAKCASSHQEFAVKFFSKDEISVARFQQEKNIIDSLKHPRIIKSYPISSHNAESDILITEYVKYGDMFSLVKEKCLTQNSHIRTYFHQVISGIEYMHSQGIAHLDLKLENLLLDENFHIKIIDFDQSHRSGEKLNCLGTKNYRAPEVLEQKCENMFAADIFSAGVMLYTWKCGQFPFAEEVGSDGKNIIYSYDLFHQDNKKFWKKAASKIGKKDEFFSEDFKDLLNGMLNRDPAKRLTIDQIKQSGWYNKPILSPESLKTYMNRKCQKFMKKFENEKSRAYSMKSICSTLSHPFVMLMTSCSLQKDYEQSIESPGLAPTDQSETKAAKEKKLTLKFWSLFSSKKIETKEIPQITITEQSTNSSAFPFAISDRKVCTLKSLDLSMLKPTKDNNISQMNTDYNSQLEVVETCEGDISTRRI